MQGRAVAPSVRAGGSQSAPVEASGAAASLQSTAAIAAAASLTLVEGPARRHAAAAPESSRAAAPESSRAAALAAALATALAAARARRRLDAQLPTAHACFFALRLPQQTDDSIMRRNALFAIEECVAMDADYRVAEREGAESAAAPSDWLDESGQFLS